MTLVDPSENLSRFILHKKLYRASDDRVKHAAFMPNPNNGETSVFRTSGISDEEMAAWVGEKFGQLPARIKR